MKPRINDTKVYINGNELSHAEIEVLYKLIKRLKLVQDNRVYYISDRGLEINLKELDF